MLSRNFCQKSSFWRFFREKQVFTKSWSWHQKMAPNSLNLKVYHLLLPIFNGNLVNYIIMHKLNTVCVAISSQWACSVISYLLFHYIFCTIMGRKNSWSRLNYQSGFKRCTETENVGSNASKEDGRRLMRKINSSNLITVNKQLVFTSTLAWAQEHFNSPWKLKN